MVIVGPSFKRGLCPTLGVWHIKTEKGEHTNERIFIR